MKYLVTEVVLDVPALPQVPEGLADLKVLLSLDWCRATVWSLVCRLGAVMAPQDTTVHSGHVCPAYKLARAQSERHAAMF